MHPRPQNAGLPVVPEIYTSAQPTGVSSAFKILYGLRLLRLLRVMRLIKVRWGLWRSGGASVPQHIKLATWEHLGAGPFPPFLLRRVRPPG